MNTMTQADRDEADSINLGDIASALLPKWKLIASTSLAAGLIAYGLCFLIPPTFTAKASFISPQQQSSAASALASLGALSGLAGSAVGIKSTADQYVVLMQSTTLSDRIIDRFKLKDLYKAKFRVDAQRALAGNVRINAGKKDSLITIEADDEDPQRAADIANAYIDELRRLTNGLALTEAQQRRSFFETQLKTAKNSLTSAQAKLQETGFNAGALKSEPKAAAETYAKTKAEIAATEIRLNALRKTLTENAPEIQQLQATLSGLRTQLSQLELPMTSSSNQDYISTYRDYKYQEALFDVYARQFEMAKLDEAREGTLIQVLDPATPPEMRSKPKRSLIAAATLLLWALAICAFLATRHITRLPRGPQVAPT
jgi:uncharacterized protein involved in exopolysaccharide biosynthesis